MAKFANFVQGTAFGVLNDLLSTLHSDDGYAQPNRYEVVINGPIRTGSSQADIFDKRERESNIDRISLRAQAISLPGRVLSTTEDNNVYGPNREVVDGVVYADEIDVQFQSGSGLEERVFFENWQKQAFNEKTWDLKYYNDYTGEIEIYILDKQDTRRYGVKLWEVFPKTINANALAYNSNNELFITEVGFTYRYWTSLDQSQNPQTSISDKVLQTLINSGERQLTRNLPTVLNRLGRNI